MAGEESGINVEDDPKVKAKGELPSRAIVLRDFGGVNLQSPREDIADNDLAWCEELIPIGSGNLAPVDGPSAAILTVSGETGAPSLVLPFVGSSIGHTPVVANQDCVLAIWSNSGNAWVVGPGGGFVATTKIATGLFTSGRTAAAQWNSTGVLIVDPTAGYYDFGVTTVGALTNLSGMVYDPTMTSTNPPTNTVGTVPSLRIIDTGSGTGATIGASASFIESSIVVSAAGTGYSVGDVLTAVGGTLTTSSAAPTAQQNQPLEITVATVSSGAVATVSITSDGYYQVAPTGTITFTGGTGSGFKITGTWAVANPYIITAGTLYTAPTVQALLGGVWTTYPITVVTSGTTLGDAIAVYAGRAWIAINRTVQFTDADSYNSFANSGSAFTINDSYLHKTITALYAANNYLYIFGDTSIDILSNVTVSSTTGEASFSRVNISASIGTTLPQSIFPYVRGLAFANASGFYVLSGATPEKISDRIDGLITATNFTAGAYGCQVMIDNILCAAFLVQFSDSFTQTPAVTRSILAVFSKGRWWFTSQLPPSGVNLGAVVSYPVNGLSTMLGWAGPTMYTLASATNVNDWRVSTKLWDLGAPILDKQSLIAAIGAVFGTVAPPGVVVTVDNEYGALETGVAQGSQLVQWVNQSNSIVQWVNNSGSIVTWSLSRAGYELLIGQANNGGGKYIGLTATGSTNVSQIRLLAVDVIAGRRW